MANMKQTLPYSSLGEWFRRKHGASIRKIVVDAGFSCPNRDGSRGSGGCTFCSPPSFKGRTRPGSVRSQVEAASSAQGPDGGRFAVYLQPNTNTYAPPEALKDAYDQAVANPRVAALFIGTRPDCLDEERLDLIASYAGRVEVWLDVGLQSSKDATLRRINRGHTFEDFAVACGRAAERGILVAAHVILGLPGESEADMMGTARDLAALPAAGVKLHNLYVARGSAMEDELLRGGISPPSMDGYAALAVGFLERTRPGVVVHRLMSDPALDSLLAPLPYWRKDEFLALVRKKFKDRGTVQGSLYRS